MCEKTGNEKDERKEGGRKEGREGGREGRTNKRTKREGGREGGRKGKDLLGDKTREDGEARGDVDGVEEEGGEGAGGEVAVNDESAAVPEHDQHGQIRQGTDSSSKNTVGNRFLDT